MDNLQSHTGATPLQEHALAVQSAGTEAGTAGRHLAIAQAKRLLRLGCPIIFSCLLMNLVTVVSIMVVGHLGEVPLAGVSLGTSFTNVTGYIVLTGMAMALDTLCGQAFGAGQHGLLGAYKQRAMVVMAVACVPIVALWANAARILVFLGQDRAIAAVAGEFARWMIPSLAMYVPLLCHWRFLQAQSLVLPVTASSGAAILCHVPVCWAMVYKSGMGTNGAALSYTISCGVNLAILALYVGLSSSCKNTWTGFSREAFKGLGQFAKLAVPSAMMICLEWWSLEILVILSGLLPNPQVETSVLAVCGGASRKTVFAVLSILGLWVLCADLDRFVTALRLDGLGYYGSTPTGHGWKLLSPTITPTCLNTAAQLYMIPLGLGYSICTVVSNELGAGKPQQAKLAVRVVMYMAFSEGLVIALTMFLLRHVWGYMFSDKQEVVSYIARMIPILGISFFMDGLHTSLSGVLTGCGKQKIGAGVNLGAFYLLGIPAAAVLAFVFHLNGMGLWLGIVCGSFVKLVVLLFIAWCISWENEALKAKDMVCISSVAEA